MSGTIRLTAATIIIGLLLMTGCSGTDERDDDRGGRTVRVTGGESSSPRPAGPPPDVRLKEELPTLEGMETLYYRNRHLDTGTLAGLLAHWKSEKGKIIQFGQLNMLLLQDTPEHLDAMQRVLEQLDVHSAQVKIEAKVIEIQRSTDFEFGFEFRADRTPVTGGMLRRIEGIFNTQSFLNSLLPSGSNPPLPFQGASLEFAAVGKIFDELGDTDLILRALELEGYAEILSSPNLVVQSGKQAELSTVTEFPIQKVTISNNRDTVTTEFKKIGVTFRVKPTIVGRDTVVLEIFPEVSSVSGFTNSGAGGSAVPIISQRSAKTTVEVKNGERLVIGGLFERRVIQDSRHVPVLGSIPLLGRFFGSKNEEHVKTEIVFVLECQILDHGGSLRRPVLRDPRNR